MVDSAEDSTAASAASASAITCEMDESKNVLEEEVILAAGTSFFLGAVE